MKRLFIYAAIAAAAIGSMTSCSDFLEVEPVGKMSEPDFLNRGCFTIDNRYVCHLTQR